MTNAKEPAIISILKQASRDYLAIVFVKKTQTWKLVKSIKCVKCTTILDLVWLRAPVNDEHMDFAMILDHELGPMMFVGLDMLNPRYFDEDNATVIGTFSI